MTLGRTPIRIVVLIDQLQGLGGTERNLVRLFPRFPRDRFDFHIVTFDLNPDVPAFRDLPLPITHVPLRRIYTPPAARAGLRFFKLLREWRADLLHCFFESSDLWGTPIAKLAGIPVISSRRDMGIHRHRLHNAMYRVVSPHFDQVQAVSEELRRWVIGQDRLDPARVVTVPNGVDLTELRATVAPHDVRARMGLPASGRLVTTVAHLRHVKGQDVWLQAAATVAGDFPDAHFVLAGGLLEPDFVARLEALAAAPQLSGRVHFVGRVADVSSLLGASSVFVLPSRSEGMSTALLEAMAAKLPIIATSVGGNPGLIEHDTTGLLVPPEDPQALAQAFRRILGDAPRAEAMGQASHRRIVAEFGIDAVVERMATHYEAVVAAAQRRHGGDSTTRAVVSTR